MCPNQPSFNTHLWLTLIHYVTVYCHFSESIATWPWFISNQKYDPTHHFRIHFTITNAFTALGCISLHYHHQFPQIHSRWQHYIPGQCFHPPPGVITNPIVPLLATRMQRGTSCAAGWRWKISCQWWCPASLSTHSLYRACSNTRPVSCYFWGKAWISFFIQ